MRTTGKICLLLFVLVAAALGQSRLQTPPPAVAGPSDDISVGYSYVRMTIPGSGPVNLNGLDVSGNVDVNTRWGLTLDSSYARTSQVPDTRHGGYVLSLLAGPVFYPVEHGNSRMFLHALAGAGLVDGAVAMSSTEYLHGFLVRPAYALGGGVERSIGGPFAVRVNGDYLRTVFFDSANKVQPQSNFRLSVSIAFQLKKRQSGTVVP